ncbi:unnamed protein product [Polarella glacialis]|uniref:Pacifastin domain-containing protein n=1 Tax=Polarella glacialis TaxID=89957 RepID=A0A813G9L2_POLGL|nr:unnamed protein product [Polarella glacialis]
MVFAARRPLLALPFFALAALGPGRSLSLAAPYSWATAEDPQLRPQASASCCPGLLFTAEDGCNTCVCPTTGSKAAAGCTKMACPAKPPGSLPAGHCSPGVAYPAGDGLNTCTCGRSGLRSDASCTSLTCPRLPPSDEPAAAEGTCCPGLSYTEGCNTCNCAPSGLKNGSTCTQILCPPSALQPGRCTPLVAYPAGDGLNTCTCSWSGLMSESNCTNLTCPVVPAPQSSVPLGTGQCCPGLLYSQGCNTCACAGNLAPLARGHSVLF